MRDTVSFGTRDKRRDCHVKGGDEEKLCRVLEGLRQCAGEKNETGKNHRGNKEEEDQVENENRSADSVETVKLVGCFMKHEGNAPR